MVAFPFILPGHLVLAVVGFCDMTALLPRHKRGETPMQRRPLHLYYIGRGLFVPPWVCLKFLLTKNYCM